MGEREPRGGNAGAADTASTADTIVAVVIELIEEGGEEAVRLRDVAARAHLSLRTIYERFADRDELVLAAVQHWMATNTYADLAPPAPGETVYDSLMRILRSIFEPWERSPRMLEAFYRAYHRAGRADLDLQTFTAVAPLGSGAAMDGTDRRYAEDIGIVLANVSWSLVSRFARGELDVTAILPALERAVFRLTANNEPDARAAVRRQGAGRGRGPR
jgi:AcrR family transcriptional regulator